MFHSENYVGSEMNLAIMQTILVEIEHLDRTTEIDRRDYDYAQGIVKLKEGKYAQALIHFEAYEVSLLQLQSHSR